jgi:uncharacterized protein YprB with RNaseH-like and TPR domain
VICLDIVTWDEENGLRTWTEDNNAFFQDYLHQHAPVVMHNGIGFDAPVLRKVWEINLYPSQVVDTLVMSRLYKPDIEWWSLPQGLGRAS